MAPAMARRKRRIEESGDDYDSDEIVVAAMHSKKSRPPLREINPAQVQAKRRRVLAGVFIPQLPSSSTGLPSTSGHSPTQTHPMLTLASNNPSAAFLSTRPRRSTGRRSYASRPLSDSCSEDELAAPNADGDVKKTALNVLSDSEFDGSSTSSGSEAQKEDLAIASCTDSSSKESGNSVPRNGKALATASAARKANSATARLPHRPAQSKKNGETVRKMTNLTSRGPGAVRGLDESLPPISDINEIFDDIAKRGLEMGLKPPLKRLQGKTIRVATMCSGTETPLLAIRKFEDVLRSNGTTAPNIEHVFSAEIEAYKQAFIERNFSPPIIFRDITEFIYAMLQDEPIATTAYGSQAAVPLDVDIVIAGTSCVDFSRLNNFQKTLNDRGESGETWEGVLAFCKRARPAIVIFENVRTAEWDRMRLHYEDAGYETGGVYVDTKDYYIPQTRQRGYLVCFDTTRVSKTQSKVRGVLWEDLMNGFRRYASSLVSSFLLPNDKISSRDVSRIDEAKREVDWSNCEIVHDAYRMEHHLGNARPYTNWQESGSRILPEGVPELWFNRQVERIWDSLDVRHLKAARSGSDMRFKTSVLNISQNVHRGQEPIKPGIVGCLTPTGQFYITDACRPLEPEEALRLQGFDLPHDPFTTETAAERQNLAGNAMTSTVILSAFLSAIIAGDEIIDGRRSASTSHNDLEPTRAISIIPSDEDTTLIVSGNETIEVSTLQSNARATMRRCLCERTTDNSRNEIHQCEGCSHTTCSFCQGNPPHKYRLAQELGRRRMEPRHFEAEVLSRMPLKLKLSIGHLNVLRSRAIGHGGDSELVNEYFRLTARALGNEFSLHGSRRTHVWTVTYVGNGSRLELVLDDQRVEWRFYVDCPKELPVNHPLRRTLTQPVGKAHVSQSLYSNSWSFRLPTPTKMKIRIEPDDSTIPSWQARLGLPGFQDKLQPEYLHVRVSNRSEETLEQDIDGRYRCLPKCGTANESLYKKIDNTAHGLGIYLFLDPYRVGLAENDPFVFANDKTKLEYGQARPVICQVDSSWRPWKQAHNSSLVNVTTDGEWISLPQADCLQPAAIRFWVQKTPSFAAGKSVATCNEATEILRVELPSDRNLESMNNKNHSTDVFSSAPWIAEAMRRELGNESSYSREDDATTTCQCCAPAKPALRWSLSVDGKTVSPYEDAKSAAQYERHIKARANPIFLQVQESRDGTATREVSVCVNFKAMEDRARGRLPSKLDSPVRFTTRISTDSQPIRKKSFPKYRIRETNDIASFDLDLQMLIDLFPTQRRQLAWMRQQEAGKGQEFTLEESEEAALTPPGWRVETTASTSIHIRGGICADRPGFGKTILTLALVQAESLERKRSDLLRELRDRQPDEAFGLLPTAATLIICTAALVQQWLQEIRDKLGLFRGVIAIRTIADLSQLTAEDVENATYVILNRSILDSNSYAEYLAAFSGVPGPATTRGRAYEQWHKFATTRIPEHLQILKDSGRDAVRKHVKKRYAQFIGDDHSEDSVPSRRLRGKDYVPSTEKKAKSESTTTKPAARSIDTDCRPLLEMFFWNRLVVDEFHYYESIQLAAIASLSADKRWALSATPPLDDFYDISKLAALLKIPLSPRSFRRYITSRNVRAINKEMTPFEKFSEMLQSTSDAIHARTHAQCQRFLDTFVRRNHGEFGMDYTSHLTPVTLDFDHLVLYTEISQHLNNMDMRIKKGSKSKTTDREIRLAEAIGTGTNPTAEDVLSRLAAFIDRTSDRRIQGVQTLIAERKQEIERHLKLLKSELPAAQSKEPEAFAKWKEANITLNAVGDEETISLIKGVFDTSQEVTLKPKVASKPKKKKASSDSADEDGDAEDEDNGASGGKHALTSQVGNKVQRLVVSTRSLRFVQNAALIHQDKAGKQKSAARCDKCNTNFRNRNDIAVSAFCGHIVCKPCYDGMKEISHHLCPAKGCAAAMQDHHLLWRDVMPEPNTPQTPHGAKMEAALNILAEVKRKDEQAILFVQNENELASADKALHERGIFAIAIDSQKTALANVETFRNPPPASKDLKPTVLVLNASDETAAGLNLQNANHVVFLSPLLRSSRWAYESTMLQAIGRVCRPGQEREVHVHRIVALNTIDVDILEHRERRSTALTEHGAADIVPPPAAKQLDMGAEPKAERTQLVRENGKFSLRPQSWLIRCGADNNAEAMARVKGKGRVAGWEAFGSLVCFSRNFLEDDDDDDDDE